MKLLNKFQGKKAGALELHRNSREYLVISCKFTSSNERDSYAGSDGKNGIWTFVRKSGDSPELTAYLESQEKFRIKMSDSYCTKSDWRNFWSLKAATLKFASNDKASTQFRKQLELNHGLYFT